MKWEGMVQLTVTQSDIIHSDEAKERKQGKKKVPNLSLYVTPRYPSIANHLFLKGYLCKWPEKKGNSLWREGEGRKRKKGRGKSLLCEPQTPPMAHFNKLKCLS